MAKPLSEVVGPVVGDPAHVRRLQSDRGAAELAVEAAQGALPVSGVASPAPGRAPAANSQGDGAS